MTLSSWLFPTWFLMASEGLPPAYQHFLPGLVSWEQEDIILPKGKELDSRSEM